MDGRGGRPPRALGKALSRSRPDRVGEPACLVDTAGLKMRRLGIKVLREAAVRVFHRAPVIVAGRVADRSLWGPADRRNFSMAAHAACFESDALASIVVRR